MTFRGDHPDELISASLTGDLTDAERAELDAHLARCETCRATLKAFGAERRILSGLPVAEPPRDLSARVRAGIESGRMPGAWWRRPGGLVAIGGSLATVAATLLAVVVFSGLKGAPAGQASGSPAASGSAAPPSAVATTAASAAASPMPGFALGPGELGYLSLNGAPFEELRLSFVNDATGASIDAGIVSGPPVAAALSPNGEWLAYIRQRGETGANEVWALHLTDGTVVALGCSAAAPFTDRLAWSPDSLFLAYTIVAIDLGSDSGCGAPEGAPGLVDAWAWDVRTGAPEQLTKTGDAYSASFWSTGTAGFRSPNAVAPLYISHAASEPWSEFVGLDGKVYDQEPVRGAFVPLLSPDGNRAIFWKGAMSRGPGAAWEFSGDGMPQVSGDFRSAGPASPWLGTPLFADLSPVGGQAFAYGSFTWGPDSNRLAFWNGAWVGAPQSADGDYPNQRYGYVGSINGGLLSADSQFSPELGDVGWVVDLTYRYDGGIALTVGFPSGGIGDPPSAKILVSGLAGGAEPYVIGGDGEPPSWNGPAVYGY